MVIGLVGSAIWWLWLLLLTLPLLVWFLAREQHDMQRLIAAFLDEVAKDLHLYKVVIEPSKPAPTPPPARPV